MSKQKKLVFKDYPAEEIANKLKEVEEFEAKYGPNNITESWRKWCTDVDYREREWTFRQHISNIKTIKQKK